MRIPKHKSPECKNRMAHAPYNFVPLPETIKTIEPLNDHSRYHTDLLTGKFTCTLTAETPLYVRAAKTIEEYGLDKQPSMFFYGGDDQPLIPGSSLHGMLRTMVEIVSASRLEPVSDEPLVYRAVGDTTSLGEDYREELMEQTNTGAYRFMMKAGYMHQKTNGDWEIIPAVEVAPGASFGRIEQSLVKSLGHLERWENSKNAFVVYATIQNVCEYTHNKKSHPVNLLYAKVLQASSAPQPDFSKFTLVKTGFMGNKHLDFVFGLPDENGVHISVSETILSRYKDQITDGQDELLKRHGNDSKQKTGVLIENQPVFYKLNGQGELVFFGHPMMFRLPYEHSPAQMLPEALRQTQGLDMAQALFGMAASQKSADQTRAGRVFITDAELHGQRAQDVLMNELTLKILSSPKPTTFQHYLTQNNPDNQKDLRHYNDDPETETVLRGHKLYWHQKESIDKVEHYRANPSDVEKYEKQFSPPVKPVKPQTQFTFTLHFENLRPGELGALLWVLEKAADPRYRLKLGMGKPYCLGSVKIESQLHLTDRTQRYQTFFDGNGWNEGWLGEQTVSQHKEICRKAFNKFVCGSENNRIDDDERIQHLLAMLNWQNAPGNEQTEYMQLGEFTGSKKEHENPRKLSKRPVLPLPGDVIQKEYHAKLKNCTNDQHKGKTSNAPKGGSPIAKPVGRIPAPPPPKQAPPAPRPRPKPEPVKREPVDKKPADLQKGDIICVIVDDAPSKGDTIFTFKNGGDEDYGIISAEKRGIRRYKKGDEILVTVLSKGGDGVNGWEIRAEPVD